MSPARPPSHKRALRILMTLGGLAVVLGVGGLLAADRYMRGKYEPVIAQIRQDVTENIDFFCEQQTVLAADPWFHESRPAGDAGTLLNAWVAWEPENVLPTDSPLAIPAGLPQSNADFKDWLSAPVDVSGLDFGWMQRLHAFDHWNILESGPLGPQEPINWVKAPIPDFVRLQLWAKFRLLHGLRTGQPLEAARDVRQLAWLTYRTETTIGGVLGAALLRLERQAYDALEAPPAEWRPLSHVQLDRMATLIMSSMVFSSIAAPPEIAKRARRCGEPPVTGCLALGESAYFAKLLKPYAEGEYREAYTAFEEDLEALSCSTALARQIWERGLTVDQFQQLEGDSQPLAGVRGKLPKVLFGSRISGILLAVSTSSLKRLKEFRAALEDPRPSQE